MIESSDFTNDIATDLWYRFRVIARALDQMDRFVGMKPASSAERTSATDYEGNWLSLLDTDGVQMVAEDFVLRALRLALEPANHLILKTAIRQTSTTLTELQTACRLNRLAVNERVNDLIQVGLVDMDFETKCIQPTVAASRLVAFVEAIQHALADKIVEEP